MGRLKLNIEKHLTDRDSANEGVWIELFPNIKMRIAYSGSSNLEYRKLSVGLALKRNLQDTKIDSMTGEEVDDLNKQMLPLFADSIVKDWKGIEDENGKPLVFNKVNALLLLEQYPEVYDKVANFSRLEENFKLTEKKAEAVKKK